MLYYIIKKISKVFYLILLGVFLIIICFYLGIRIFENQITRLVIQSIEKNLSLKVHFKNVDILPIKYFPNLTLRFEKFSIAHDNNAGDSNLDSLIQFKTVYIALKSLPLLRNQFDIQQIVLDGFNINYFTDDNGRSNFDFLIKSDTTSLDTTSGKNILHLILRQLSIKNLNLQYLDKKNDTQTNIFIPDFTIKAKIVAESIDAYVKGSFQISQLKAGEISFRHLQPFKINCNIGYQTGKVKIEELKINANGMEMETIGNLGLGDSTYINIKVDLKKMALEKLFDLIPDSIKKLYAINAFSGNMGCIMHINGYFYDTIMVPAIQTNFYIKNAKIKMKEYPEVKNININVYANIPNYNNLNSIVAKVGTFSCNIGDSKVSFSGQASNLLQPIYRCAFNIFVHLTDFKSFIPDSLLKDISGDVNMNIVTCGKIPAKIDSTFVDYILQTTSLRIDIKNVMASLNPNGQFKHLNGNIIYKPDLGLEINNFTMMDEEHQLYTKPSFCILKYKGRISDFDHLSFIVDTLSMNTNVVSFNSKINVSRVTTAPNFNILGNIKLNLNEVSKILPDTMFNDLNGTIVFQFKSKGKINIDSLTASLMPIIFENSQLKLLCHNINFSLKTDSIIKIENFYSDISFANDSLWIHNMSGKAYQISFRVDSTSIWNIYPSFIKKDKQKKLIGYTNLWVDTIDYAMFLPFIVPDTTEKISDTNNSSSETDFSPSYIIRGKLVIDHIIYNKININQLSTKFRLADSLYIIDDLTFKAFEGEMTTSISYDIREKPFKTIEFKNQTQHINIKKLLADNDNFNQTNLTDRQIDGLFSGTFYGRVVMTDTGIVKDRMNLLGNFTIENGGIYNYEPAMQLSKFTNLKELDNIVFRKLESSVFIYNNQIYFPKTDIVSTAMDLSVYGMASFGPDYEYHIILYPGDILLGKSHHLLKKQGLTGEKFEGENKTDRSGIYLVSLKRGNETKNGFDTRQLQQLMKTTIRVQERGLNLVFHPKIFNFSTEIDRKEIKKKTKHENKVGE